jgi:isopenicillin-N N-acyltransferase like protein
VAPQGRIAVRATGNGILAHTNHYLDEALIGGNVTIGRSSRTRLDRIGEILNGRTAPLTLDEFVTFSQDRHDGPDNSLWRTGSTPTRERTLASWILSLPKEDPPELFCRLANPGVAEKQTKIRLDTAFWEKPDGLIF